jgi:hypothetical protein
MTKMENGNFYAAGDTEQKTALLSALDITC